MLAPVRQALYLIVLLTLLSGCASPVPALTPTPSAEPSQTGPSQTGAKTVSQLTTEDCAFQNQSDATIQCASLTVPEDRKQPTGKTIKLHVAIIKSSSNNPQAEPVLLLSSSPSPFLRYAGQLSYAFPGFYQTRDMILMDQRGVGASEPNLDCPELTDLYYAGFDLLPFSKEMAAKTQDANSACHDRLAKSGINLSAYTSQASAADFEDLRQALGIQKWSIYSIGYGARLASILMRDYPQGISDVIMDSPVPEGTSVYLNQAAYSEQALDRVFQRCAGDALCQAAYPNLKNVFLEDIDQLNLHPAEVSAHDLESGKDYTFRVDGNRLISQTLAVIDQARSNTLPILPKMIYQVKDGKYDELSTYLGMVSYLEPVSGGMQAMVYCLDDAHSTTQAEINASNAGATTALAQYYEAANQINFSSCQIWDTNQSPSGKASASFGQPVSSSIPTLILVGDFSVSTPTNWGLPLTKTLPVSYYVEFKAASAPIYFSELWSSCAAKIGDEFLAKPTAQPDTSCASEQKNLTWITLK